MREDGLYVDAPIKNRIKKLRTDHQWTQEKLASHVGISRQSINSIEREKYVPSLRVAMLLARAFDCPFEQVFTLETAQTSINLAK